MADGGLRVGSVFATFAVNTAAWVKGLDEAAKATAGFLKKVEGIGGKLGGMGALMAGGLGLSVAALKDSTPEAAAAFEAVSTSAKALSSELVSAALPAIQSVSAAVVSVTEALRTMDPEVKSQIASATVWTAGLLLVAGGLAKLAGTTAAVIDGIRLVRATLISLEISIAPVLAVVAALAAIAVTAAIIVEAWSDTSTGFQESLLGMWKAVKAWAASVGQLFVDVGKFIGSVFGEVFDGLTEALAAVVRAMATAFGTIAEALPDSMVPKQVQDVLLNLSNYTGKQMREDLSTAGKGIVSGLKTAADFVVDGVMTSVEFAERGFARIGKKLKDVFQSATGGAGTATEEIKSFSRDYVKALAASAQEARVVMKPMGDLVANLADITAPPPAARTVDHGLGVAGGIIAGAAGGAVGGVLSAGAEGAAAGGPMGAIVAVAAELLTQSETFSTAVTMVTNVLGNIANILGDGLAPVLNALGPIFQIVESVVGAVLTPILTAVADTLAGFAPIFEVLNVLFQGLAPLITMVVQLLSPVTMSLRLFQPALKGLFEVVKFISGIILEVSKFMAGIFNGLISAVQGVLRSLGNIKIFGGKPLAFLNSWADGLESAKVNVDAMSAAQDTLTDLTYDSAKAKAEEISATYKAKESLQKFGDSLTNVPEGFKLAARRFASDMADTVVVPGSGAAASSAVLPVAQPLVDNSTNTVNVILPPAAAVDPVAVADAVAGIMEDDNWRRTGSNVGGYESRFLAVP